jgi:hypothetical protein
MAFQLVNHGVSVITCDNTRYISDIFSFHLSSINSCNLIYACHRYQLTGLPGLPLLQSESDDKYGVCNMVGQSYMLCEGNREMPCLN